MREKTPLEVKHQQLIDDLERSHLTLVDIFKELHNPDLYRRDRHEELKALMSEHKAEEEKIEALKKEIAEVTHEIAEQETE